MAESWWVTIRGQARKFVTCQQVAADAEFLAFLNHAGALLLLVRRDELIARMLEQAVEAVPAAAKVVGGPARFPRGRVRGQPDACR